MYILFFVLFLSLLLAFLLLEIKRIEKTSKGLAHLLEKSEAGRINSEQIKNKVLLMIDDLPEGLLIIDKDEKISLINNRAAKFLGVNKKQVLNKHILDLSNLSNVKKIVFPMLVNFKGAHSEELEIKKNFILDLKIEPLVFGKNNVAKLIILRDITALKSAEASRNQFVSVVAHQLKSPLALTRLSLKMMLSQDFGKINRKQKDILQKTYKENESLIYLVEDLLKEVKIDATDQPGNRALINLEELVLSVAEFYKDEIRRKKISFKFKKSQQNLPKFIADQEKIKIVIQNLFDNAVKYTPPKGKIEVSITPRKGEIEFSIKDSGVGIPEDQKEKIFKRFSRAINALQGKESGSGLGLFIAKDIIEKHKGRIWFQSKENEGSTFFFVLPF